MIFELDNKLISSELFERKFVCDLNTCKGACCIHGDQGAPLKSDEIDILENVLDAVIPYMRAQGIKAVEKTGVFYMDPWNKPAVTLVNDQECAFVFFDEKNIAKCSIEQAYLEGKTTWKKPISCHLYPIRVSEIGNGIALNYDEWKICEPACSCGENLNVPAFRFLKEPLIREFGTEFYDDMLELEKIYLDENLKE
jgi:hypothetical protein